MARHFKCCSETSPATLLSVALVFIVALAAPSGALWAAPEPEWREKYWNPVPMADDVVLPLPCGGAMAFRRVDTTLPGNWLTDFRIQLGAADSRHPYSSFTRFEYLAGPLSDSSDPGRRYFLLGKYEVTEDQFAAVMEDDCPRASMRGRLPKAGATWFDGVEFAKRLTTWINGEAPDALPKQDGRKSFLRLPTEVEWEFAARGGRSIGEAGFRSTLYPMPKGGISQYVWFQGQRSCGGKTQLVGQLQPNPLGLFDILGNVEELVLEPFRMNRAGRLHGQNGGFIAKGGSCLTDEAAVSTASRTEFSYFNDRTGQPLAPQFAGIRLIVAAPILVSHGRIGELEADWQEAIESGGQSLLEEDVDPADTLEAMAKVTSDFEIRDELTQLAALVRSQESARADIERRAIQTAIESGAFIIRKYVDDAHDRIGIQKVVDLLGKPTDAAGRAEVKTYRTALERIDGSLDLTVDVYTTVLAQSATDYGPDLVDDQLEIVAKRFQEIAGPKLATYAEIFADHLRRWQGGKGLTIPTIRAELDEL